MKLSREVETFLRHWMYDEVHYQTGNGMAKRLQLQHRVPPADLAIVIAAAMPDPAELETAGLGPPPTETPTWPWSDASQTLGLPVNVRSASRPVEVVAHHGILSARPEQASFGGGP